MHDDDGDGDGRTDAASDLPRSNPHRKLDRLLGCSSSAETQPESGSHLALQSNERCFIVLFCFFFRGPRVGVITEEVSQPAGPLN